MANGRWNREFIKSLVSKEGVVLDNTKNISKEIKHYFGKLYSKPTHGSWRIKRLDWSLISTESANRLDCSFSEEETHNVVF